MEEKPKISIVLADDHAIVREGIAALLRTEPDFSIIGQASDGAQALEMIRELKPDVAIVDLNMPKLHGIEVIRRTHKRNSQVRMIVLSVQRDPRIVREALGAGASGVVLKDDDRRHLVDAIRHVMDGGLYFSPQLKTDELLAGQRGGGPADPLESLSAREYQVLCFLVEGLRPKEIAARLDISPKTVDTYRSSLMRKLHIYDLAGLVKYAVQRKLTTLE